MKTLEKNNSIDNFEDVWMLRQLLFIGRVARMDDDTYPPIFIASAKDSKRNR